MLEHPVVNQEKAQNKAAKAPVRFGFAAGAGALGLLLLFAALRWNSYDAPLVRDEGEYAYAAQLLKAGVAPYEHSFLQKPPMVIYSYALADALAPGTFWSPRLVAYGFVLLTTCLVGAVSRREWGRGAAFPAMWVFTILVLLPGIEQFTANTEMFMLLPLMGMVAIYVFNRDSDGRAGPWFATGLLGAVTFLYKYTALPVLLVVYAAWLLDTVLRSGFGFRKLGLPVLASLCGAAAGAAAILGFFLLRDGGWHLWECTVRFNRFYTGLGGFGMDSLKFRLAGFWDAWWVIFLLPLVLLIRPERRLWFWGALFLAACVSTAMSPYGHYYLVLTPIWAVLTAAAIQRLSVWMAQKIRWPDAWIRRGLTAAVVLILFWPDATWMLRSKQQFIATKLPGIPFADCLAVGDRVAQLTKPDDFVYVGGSEPQILRYARRVSPTRFVIAYPLMIPTPLAAGYQQEAIRDIKEHPPAVIVLVPSNTSWLKQPGSPPEFLAWLKQEVAQDYQLVGGYVPEHGSGRWVEPLPPQDNASLVVFRRISGTAAH